MGHDKLHKSDHENGGSDEPNLAGLSGLLVTPQTPAVHNQPASTIQPNTTNFDRILSAADDTTQKALETIDSLSVSKTDPVSMAGWRVSPVTNGIQNVLGWHKLTDSAVSLASATPITPSVPGYNSHFVLDISAAVGLPFTLRLLGADVDDTDAVSGRASGTTTSVAANKLIDSLATFQTDNIVVGQYVYNSTDDTWAEVLAIDSQIQLSLSADIMVSGEVYDVGTIEDIAVSANGYVMSGNRWVDAPLFDIVEVAKSATADIYRTSYWKRADDFPFVFDGARLEWFPSSPTWDIDVVVYHLKPDGTLTDIQRFNFANTDAISRAGDDEPGMAVVKNIAYTIPGTAKDGIIIQADDQTNIGTFFLGADLHE